MCGIAGIFNPGGKPVSPAIIKKMTDIMAHRGPDGEGQWVEGNVGLGHRRLMVIDLTPAGQQPMASDDNALIITYSGETYNFPELRAELEALGYRFHSGTDTEVVLKAYQEWGTKCLDRFNGMFAFAIWDKRTRRLFLARDRYGIKPLYYFFNGKTFIFASEIKAILQHPVVTAEVSHSALLEYFTFQNIFSDLTLFKNIKLLTAGCYMYLSPECGPPNETRYWDYNFREPESPLSECEYAEELDRLFSQACQRQLISDVPVGAQLSGGLDSAAITAIAARNIPYLTTFTIGFDVSSASGLELGCDERAKAESLSNLYKTEHYEAVLKAGDMERVMEKLIWHLEDLRVGQCYPNFYLNRLASKFVKVLLCGAGGDELFAGYPWRYFRVGQSPDIDTYIDRYYSYWQRMLSESMLKRVFNPEILKAGDEHSTHEVFKAVIEGDHSTPATALDYINKSLYFEIKTFLQGLFLVEDKLSMAHGVEIRVPFMDNDLVDFAMKVPVEMKLANLKSNLRVDENLPGPQKDQFKTNDGKIILRKALARYVPEEIINQKKQGFSAPDAGWFRGESIDYIKDLLLMKRARINDYLDPEVVKELIGEHISGKENHRLLIWSLLSFEWWCRIFL